MASTEISDQFLAPKVPILVQAPGGAYGGAI